MKKKKIVCCITLFNPGEDSLKNIDFYTEFCEKIYLIDNTPDVNNKDKFKNKKIKYIANKKNLGIATALNIGCTEAINDGYHFILTMDQDSKFAKKEFIKLIEFVEKNDMSMIGIVSPWQKTKNHNEKPDGKIEELVEVMTSGNILNLDLYQKIGGFRDEYFIDCVDMEYCMRLNKNHYKVIRLNYCVLEHELGNIKEYRLFNKIVYSMNHNHIRKYYITRNILKLYDEYHELFPERCEYIKKGIFSMIKKVSLFEKNKYKKLRNICRGYRDYKRNKMGPYDYKN